MQVSSTQGTLDIWWELNSFFPGMIGGCGGSLSSASLLRLAATWVARARYAFDAADSGCTAGRTPLPELPPYTVIKKPAAGTRCSWDLLETDAD